MEKFTFFKSWAEIYFEIEEEDPALAQRMIDAIIKYGIYGIDESDKLPRAERRTFKLMIQTMNKGKTAVENGQKGGAPEGNQNAKKRPINVTNGKNNQGLNEKQPPAETQNKHYTNTIANTIDNNQKPLPNTSTDYHSHSRMPIPETIALNQLTENHLPNTTPTTLTVVDAAAAFENEIQQEEQADAFGKVWAAFEKLNINLLSSTAGNDIARYFDAGMEPGVMLLVAEISGNSNAQSWKYPKAILEKYLQRGILTTRQAQEDAAAFENQKSRRKREQEAKAAGTRPADYYDPADYKSDLTFEDVLMHS